MRNTRIIIPGVILFITGLLASCGGGGGADPDPVINPVEEITEADLTAAGVPALPVDNGTSKIGSITSNMDLWEFMAEGDGTGRVVLDHTDLPARRIVGWALYRVQADSAGEDLPLSMRITGSGFGGFRAAYAVGNYSTGKWEIGGRIVIDVISAGFSLGNQYTSPQGNLYILVAAGHPGTANPPTAPLTVDPPQVKWTGPNITGQNWTASVSRPQAGTVQFQVTPGTGPASQFTLSYSDTPANQFLLTFPAVLNLTDYSQSDFSFTSLWDSGIPDFINGVHVPEEFPFGSNTPLIRFYNTNELNGAGYPFSVRGWADGDFNGDGYALNTLMVELNDASEGVVQGFLRDGTSNTMVAVPNATLTVLNDAGEQVHQSTTNDQGHFSFTVKQTGNFILKMTKAETIDSLYLVVSAKTGGTGTTGRIDFFEDQSGWI